jgi:hypothetical protein
MYNILYEKTAQISLVMACKEALYIELLLLKLRYKRRRKEEEEGKLRLRKKRSTWVRPWVQRRKDLGAEVLLKELREEDQSAYRNIMRMSPEKFDELFLMVQCSITKNDTHMRAAVPAKLKLEVTLRFLASGDSLTSLSYFFRVPVPTISQFLPSVLEAIVQALALYLKVRKQSSTTSFL